MRGGVGRGAQFGGAGEGHNPEQLFALGWSSCFGQAILVLARKHGLDGQDARVTCTIAMEKDEVSFGFKAELRVSIPGADTAKVQALVEDAHKICPYSRATRGNVPVTLTVGTASVSFTLDKNGRAHSASGSIQLRLKTKRDPKTKKSAFIGGDAPVMGRLQHGTWSAAWGFATGAAAPATLTVEIDLGATRYGATVTITSKLDAKHARFKH